MSDARGHAGPRAGPRRRNANGRNAVLRGWVAPRMGMTGTARVQSEPPHRCGFAFGVGESDCGYTVDRGTIRCCSIR